jgi:hypothetical protein
MSSITLKSAVPLRRQSVRPDLDAADPDVTAAAAELVARRALGCVLNADPVLFDRDAERVELSPAVIAAAVAIVAERVPPGAVLDDAVALLAGLAIC